MISKLVAILGVGVVLLAGCSSVPTRVNKGPVNAGTFSFMQSTAPEGNVSESREEAHKQIQGAIAGDLKKKGLKQVASGGDVQVGYMVVVANNATTTTYDEYFGYGEQASALTKKAHKAVAGKSSRDYFEVGAIVIDVVDSKSSKLLYRSYVVTDVQSLTPENRADRINSLVASCLGKLKVNN